MKLPEYFSSVFIVPQGKFSFFVTDTSKQSHPTESRIKSTSLTIQHTVKVEAINKLRQVKSISRDGSIKLCSKILRKFLLIT